MADPSLEGQYPVRGLYQALAIAAMCVQEKPHMRPAIADVVTALNFLASQKYDPNIQVQHKPKSKCLPSNHDDQPTLLGASLCDSSSDGSSTQQHHYSGTDRSDNSESDKSGNEEEN